MGDPIRLAWDGPLLMYGAGEDSRLIDDVPSRARGVYLWTVPREGLYYPLDVGEGNLADRLDEHRKGLKRPRDYVYGPEGLKQGEVKDVYNQRMHREPTEDDREKARRFAELVRLFILPISEGDLPGDVTVKDMSLYLEAAVAYSVLSDPRGRQIFRPTTTQLHPRTEGTADIAVYAAIPDPIVGLPSVMWV